MATQDQKRINHPRECCICFDDISGHVVQTKCGHVYHFECLDTWLNTDDDASNSVSTDQILQNMTEDEQLAHVIDLTRDAIRPNNKVCPSVSELLIQKKIYTSWKMNTSFPRWIRMAWLRNRKKPCRKGKELTRSGQRDVSETSPVPVTFSKAKWLESFTTFLILLYMKP